MPIALSQPIMLIASIFHSLSIILNFLAGHCCRNIYSRVYGLFLNCNFTVLYAWYIYIYITNIYVIVHDTCGLCPSALRLTDFCLKWKWFFFFSIYKSHQNVIVSILVFETETSFLFVHAHGVKLPDATLSLVDSDAVTGCRLS